MKIKSLFVWTFGLKTYVIQLFLTAILLPHYQLKGHSEPRNEAGSQSPAEHLVEFEPLPILNVIPKPLRLLYKKNNYLFCSLG